MSQLLLDHDYTVSLPEKRTSDFSDKARFSKKELSDTAKGWLVNHDSTNWKEMSLIQDFKTKSKKVVIDKKILWKLPGTKEKQETDGIWINEGCFNIFGHPEHKAFVKRNKRYCLYSNC